MVPRQLGPFDKLVHFSIYGVFGYLTASALANRWSVARVAAVVIVGMSLFGAVDEWHQHFIPGRSTEIADWLADSIGGALGVAIWTILGPLRTKRQHA